MRQQLALPLMGVFVCVCMRYPEQLLWVSDEEGHAVVELLQVVLQVHCSHLHAHTHTHKHKTVVGKHGAKWLNVPEVWFRSKCRQPSNEERSGLTFLFYIGALCSTPKTKKLGGTAMLHHNKWLAPICLGCISFLFLRNDVQGGLGGRDQMDQGRSHGWVGRKS